MLNGNKGKKMAAVYPQVLPDIVKVEFQHPYTLVYWSDFSTTMVKCQTEEKWDTEKAIMAAMAKRAYGNRGYNDKIREAIRLSRKVRKAK
jgi:hypothetical protein